MYLSEICFPIIKNRFAKEAVMCRLIAIPRSERKNDRSRDNRRRRDDRNGGDRGDRRPRRDFNGNGNGDRRPRGDRPMNRREGGSANAASKES